jgi:predicted CXXCH cytochrome family protein
MARQQPFACSLLTLMLASCVPCGAQEFDAIISDQSPQPATLLDEIADPAERRDFQALYERKDATQRLKLAEAFLSNYPRSWVLSEVYEIAAKAAIELDDYDRTILHARASLAILPENPLLLVSLADVEAHQGLRSQAERDAHEALDELDRFARPASVPEEAWPEVERQLRASSYFVLGRVAAGEALASSNPPRNLMLKAEEHLSKARQLNPDDSEIPYLKGLTDLALGERDEAAVDFAAAYRLGGATERQALDQLHRLYQATHPLSTFEEFLMRLESREPAPSSPGPPPAAFSLLPAYAGSETCRPCHADIYEHWSTTGMARMFRPYRPENVIGDFTRENEFYEGDDVQWKGGTLEVIPGVARRLFARMMVQQGRHYFEIRGSDGWRRYPVDYTIGSKWQQAYATRLPDGQIHVFPIQYNALEKRWLNFWKIIDAPGSPRADLDRWEHLDASTSYQANCAACHTSQLRNVKGGGFAVAGPEFRETGVDCEMCHGPSASHVAAMMEGRPYPMRPIDPPVDFTKISAAQFIAICSQCHLQSAIRQPGHQGELNYSTKGQFFISYKLRPYGEFSRQGFYKDGRFRETTFIVESLMRSQCFRKGLVSCGNCHNPHPADAARNPTSLKFLDQPDRMCVQCHTSFGEPAAIERHTRHLAASEGSRCVSCHMPRMMDALLFEARTHRIDDIPEADRTLRFGQEESPNACLLCHHEKNSEWAKQKLLAWKQH